MINQNFGTEDVSLTYSKDGLLAIIKMQDQHKKNALTLLFIDNLLKIIDHVIQNQKVRVVILSGLDEVFCSGADDITLFELSNGQIKPTDILCSKRILDIPIPVIAAMTGHAVGGGLALGLCADIILIAKESRYGCSFMNLGFTPGMGITKLLENVLSPCIAHEMQYTGEFKLGKEFIGKGGFNEILNKKDIFSKSIEIAERIIEKPRPILEILKRYLTIPKRQLFEQTITFESMMHQISFSQSNIKELIDDNYIK